MASGEAANLLESFEDKLRLFVLHQPIQKWGAHEGPESIHLSSKQGRTMLREALDTPYMEPFFTVAPQIDTQPEYTCSTTSLMVALNSLKIHPGRATWNGMYCFNSLESMSCCRPVLHNPNVSMDQFSYLAVCNDTRAFPVQLSQHWTLDKLRNWVKMAASRSDVVMVMNYGRRAMKQEGEGHYLLLSGYHQKSDHFLFIDTAKHKYLPSWIPLQMLLDSLKTKDDRKESPSRSIQSYQLHTS